MKVGGCWLLLFPIALSYEQNDLVFRERSLNRGERCGATNEQRNYDVWKNDNIPEWKDRNPVRRRDAFVVPLKSLRQGLLEVIDGEK